MKETPHDRNHLARSRHHRVEFMRPVIGNRRRRHRIPPLQTAARHAVLVVPNPQRRQGVAAGNLSGEEAGLMRLTFILGFLLLSGCNDATPATQSSKAAEAARIEREVARRVEAARLDSAVRINRLRTIRVLGFIVLTGGALSGLLWLRNRDYPGHPAPRTLRSGPRPPLWDDHYPSGNGRVIDLPAGPPNPGPAQSSNPTPQQTSHETPPRA
jgi:hypothetical protein